MSICFNTLVVLFFVRPGRKSHPIFCIIFLPVLISLLEKLYVYYPKVTNPSATPPENWKSPLALSSDIVTTIHFEIFLCTDFSLRSLLTGKKSTILPLFELLKYYDYLIMSVIIQYVISTIYLY